MLTTRDLEEIKILVRDEVRKEVRKAVRYLPSKEEFYAKMDELVGEIKSLREEVTIVTGYKDQIEDHETRIEKLEQTITPV